MQHIDSKIQEKSNPIGILSFIAHFLEEQGLDPQIIFDQFEIKLEDLKNNLMPVSLQTQGNIFKAVEELTGCDHLGLLIGKDAKLSNIGPLRFLVLNAATMRDALESLFSYGSMWYRGQKLDLQEDQGYARICMLIDGEIPRKEQYQTAYLAAIVSIIELVLAKPWRPTLVRISYPKPKSAHLYEKFFRCPVWFGQTQHEILFPQEQLDQARTGHDNQLDDFLRQHLSELQSNDSVDVIAQVCKIIEELLPYHICNIERVAEYFSIHRFTLYRYLNKHHTTFEALLEITRKKIAIKLLKNPKLMIIEVANQLGYDDQANFTRAFKRWYGITPGRWRRAGMQA
ncbi:AraC family transcriptional regulator [Acinetobacter sp. ANC 3832]|uniref:AraC family transcriptional regulator n=1 Tax=Acinetobacter sp. ANC 3832 TaxID=1977874 RepID=UPI000A3439E6|nr:AraC family transcriptional regulator [Acinetobacter sp. ANC 3832]OTG91178.1 AraC family transcriptional regulator [Acinetobacter sp. ANC 3832]